MSIVYRETRDFSRDELERLFLSVEWSSGHFPDKLAAAMKNFATVFSAGRRMAQRTPRVRS